MTRRIEQPYTRLSRFNPKLTFEQYKVLVERKKHARANLERVKYKDLVEKWGVRQYYMATAVNRGIKQETGFDVEVQDTFNYKPQHSFIGSDENIERFAALVAAAEREACAQVCDRITWSNEAKFFATAIRQKENTND